MWSTLFLSRFSTVAGCNLDKTLHLAPFPRPPGTWLTIVVWTDNSSTRSSGCGGGLHDQKMYFLPQLGDLLDISEECLLSPPDTNRPINHITAHTKVGFLLSYNTDVKGISPSILKNTVPVTDKMTVLMHIIDSSSDDVFHTCPTVWQMFWFSTLESKRGNLGIAGVGLHHGDWRAYRHTSPWAVPDLRDTAIVIGFLRRFVWNRQN